MTQESMYNCTRNCQRNCRKPCKTSLQKDHNLASLCCYHCNFCYFCNKLLWTYLCLGCLEYLNMGQHLQPVKGQSGGRVFHSARVEQYSHSVLLFKDLKGALVGPSFPSVRSIDVCVASSYWNCCWWRHFQGSQNLEASIAKRERSWHSRLAM